jgi:hypothetical protein
VIRAAYEEYKREVLDASPLVQALVSNLAMLWLVVLMQARAIDRLAAA